MFGQFGEVVSVKQDERQWCYIRYNHQEEAQAAYNEMRYSTLLASFGVAQWKVVTSDTSEADSEENLEDGKQKKKVVRPPPEESDMELFIGNYPHSMSLKQIKRLFKHHARKMEFRTMRVTDQVGMD